MTNRTIVKREVRGNTFDTLVLLVGLLFYPLQSFVIPTLLPTWLVQPGTIAGWLLLGCLSGIYIKARIVPGEMTGKPASIGLIYGTLFSAFYFIIGTYIGGLGRNPLGYAPILVALNTLWALSIGFGAEMFRSLLLSLTRRKMMVIAVSSALYTASMIPLMSMPGLSFSHEAVRVLGTKFPVFLMFLLGGVLNYAFGPLVALGFTSTVQTAMTMLPFLPNLNWIEASFTSIIAVSTVYMIALRMAADPGDRLGRSEYTRFLLGFLFVFLVWLGNGMLGFQAVVVTSGSMRPGINVGDLVIVKVGDKSYGEGSIILFNLNGGYVLHRVHDVENVNGSITIHTKGDNNSDVDPWTVTPQMIVGNMVFKLPKIGWLTIWVKQLFNGR